MIVFIVLISYQYYDIIGTGLAIVHEYPIIWLPEAHRT